LAALTAHKIGGIIPIGAIFKVSSTIGQLAQARAKQTADPLTVEERM
jgi:hypothetical protein